MGEKEINITYETLFELLRREKSREELQKLDKSFFSDVNNYIKEKESMTKGSDELFSAESSENIKKQIENAKKILKELYEKRERKIADLAIYKSRTGSELVDNSVFLEEEKALFDALVEIFNKYRKDFLMNILKSVKPTIVEEEKETKEKMKTEIEERKVETEKEDEVILIRFLHAVPKFVGKELEVYGPFEAEDVASLPKDIAKVLINKGRAEKIEENQ